MNSSWPKYFKDRLWLGNNKEAFVGIATLWSYIDEYVKAVDDVNKEKIAVIGQLHTKRGIEFIFRNIWLNPKIRYIVLCGQDGCGAGEGLLEFMKTGEAKGSFFSQVNRKDIEEFIKSIEVVDGRGKGVEEIMKTISSLKYKPPFSTKTKEFADVTETKVRQSENSVFRVEAETVGETWLQILELIQKFGKKIPRIHIYGGYEKMVLNLAAVITKEDISNPKIWHFFDFDKESLKEYFKSFFTADRGDDAYTYGERMFAYEADGKKIDQVTLMAKKMQSFEYNKGAVVTLWQPHIDNFPVRKPWRTPCLTQIQGICMEDKFYLTAYFRSNDMYGAWPLNAMALRKMQTEIAKKIGKNVGDLTIISHCAFIDESDMGEVEDILTKNEVYRFNTDPRGNVLIETDGEEIVVKHMTGEGELIKEYRQNVKVKRGVERLSEILVKDRVMSRIDHSIDIGVQLARAEMAIKLKLKFEQDREVK